MDRALSEIEARSNVASLLWMDESAFLLAMNERQLERARRVINQQLDGDLRVRALTALARASSHARRELAVDDALAATEALPDRDARERAYREIAPHLSPHQLARALAAAERIGEPSGIEYLPAMLPYSSQPAPEPASDPEREPAEGASTLSLNEARTSLACLVHPTDALDRLTLVRAIEHDLPPAQLKGEREGPAAADYARRMGELGAGDAAYALLRLGRDDEVTLAGLVEVAQFLDRDEVLDIEERLVATTVRTLSVEHEGTLYGNVAPNYLGGRLSPALARIGEARRALKHAAAAGAELARVDAYLGIAACTAGATRSHALAEALATVRDLRDYHRRRQLGRVAQAVAGDPALAAVAWRDAIEWARTHPRHEAIEMLALMAPVAATVGGTALVDETLNAIDHVLHWWP